jgi:hypothetical protein
MEILYIHVYLLTSLSSKMGEFLKATLSGTKEVPIEKIIQAIPIVNSCTKSKLSPIDTGG